jgi:hypothetical protein
VYAVAAVPQPPCTPSHGRPPPPPGHPPLSQFVHAPLHAIAALSQQLCLEGVAQQFFRCLTTRLLKGLQQSLGPAYTSISSTHDTASESHAGSPGDRLIRQTAVAGPELVKNSS